MSNSLRNIRKRVGMTLSELSEKSGASISLISKFENSSRTINATWRKRLAHALGVQEDELIGDNVKSTDLPEDVPWFTSLMSLELDTNEVDRIIPAGSTIFLDTSSGVEDGKVYAIKVGDNLYVRRARMSEGPMRFEPDSWSGSFSTIFMQGRPVEVVGRVVGATVTLK